VSLQPFHASKEKTSCPEYPAKGKSSRYSKKTSKLQQIFPVTFLKTTADSTCINFKSATTLSENSLQKRMETLFTKQFDQTEKPLIDTENEKETPYGPIKRKPSQLNFEINTKLISAVSINGIINICKDNVSEFNHVNISTTFHRIGKLSKKTKLNPQQEEFIQELTQLMLLHLKSMESMHISIIAWALATLGINDKVIFDALADEASEKMLGILPQNISILLWAFATANFRNEKLLNAMTTEAFNQVEKFNPQDIAHTLWACATLQFIHKELFNALMVNARNSEQHFHPQAITYIFWACATLGLWNEKLFNHLANKACNNKRDFTPQHISTILRACAMLGFSNEALFNTLKAKAHEKISDFNPLDITHTFWACATLGYSDEELFDTLAVTACNKIQDFDPQNISITLWACATLRYSNEELGLALTKEALNKIQNFDPQSIAITLWACATLVIINEELFFSLSKEALNKIEDFNPQNIANTLWALAVLDQLSLPFLEKFLSLSINWHHLEPIHIQQVYYVYLFVDYIKGYKEIKWPMILSTSFNSLESYKPKINQQSKLHLDVAAHLFNNCSYEFYYETIINRLVIDIAIPEKQIAIEIDGPHHSTFNTKKELGSTIFKRKLLVSMGWKVINIPYWIWDPMDHNQKNKYLTLQIF
jgi:predicted lipoprotein